MLERRVYLLARLRQRKPGLDPVKQRTALALVARRTLRMRDPAPCCHPIQFAGTNRKRGPE